MSLSSPVIGKYMRIPQPYLFLPRKRMSIIVEDENQNIILFCKGADSIIFDRLTSNTSIRLRETTNFSLKCFGNEGLRTLLYSSRTLSSDEYRAWAERYHVINPLFSTFSHNH